MWQNSFTETKESKGYFALQMRVQCFIVGESSGGSLKQLVTWMCGQEEESDRWMLLSSLSSLYSAQHSAQETMQPTCRVCLPISVNLISIILHRHAEVSAFTQPARSA